MNAQWDELCTKEESNKTGWSFNWFDQCIKSNPTYYQEKVLHPTFTEEISTLYSNNSRKVKLLIDKANRSCFEKCCCIPWKNTSIVYIPFQHVLASPLTFHLWTILSDPLNRVFYKRMHTTIDRLWKLVKEEWKSLILGNFPPNPFITEFSMPTYSSKEKENKVSEVTVTKIDFKF